MLAFSKVDEIWHEIRDCHDYDEAERLYHALQDSQKETLDAVLAYAFILENKNQPKTALGLLESLAPECQRHFLVVKKQGELLVLLKEYEKALTLFTTSKFKDNVQFRLGYLECLYRMKQYDPARELAKQFTLAERKDPAVAGKLAYAYYYLGQDPTAAITFIPTYKQNIQLLKPLIQIYSMTQQYDLLKSLFNSLSDPIKNNHQILIMYSNAMLEYKGDPKSTEKIHIEINAILLGLLDKTLSRHDYRKVINIILHNNLRSQYQFYIQDYINKNPKDTRIAELANPSQPKSWDLETLLKNPEENQTRLLQYAYKADKEKDFKTAKYIYQEILKKDKEKNHYLLWSQYAAFLMDAQFYNEAIPLYRELIDKYPLYAPLYLGLAVGYEKIDHREAQLKLLREGNQKCPDDFPVLNLLGQALTHEEKFHEVVDLYSAFSQNYPSHIEIRVQLAYAYCRIGFASTGIALLQEIMAKSPHINEVIAALGHCLLEAHLFAKVDEHFKQYHNHIFYWTKFVGLHVRGLQKQGKFKEALTILEKMYQECNASLESYLFLTEFFRDAIKQKTRFEEASFYIPKALNDFPNEVRLHINVSFYYLAMGDIASASKYCQLALTQEPNHINAKILANKIAQRQKEIKSVVQFSQSDFTSTFEELIHQGWNLLNNKKFSKVEGLIENLQKLYPHARKTHHFIAEYYVTVGLYQKAESSLLSLEANYGALTVEESLILVTIYEFTARLKEGIKRLNELLNMDPSHIEILLRLSYFYTQSNELDKATEACFNIIKVVPNELRAILQLSRIALTQKSTRAFIYLAKAEAIFPKNLQVALYKAFALKKFKRDEEALSTLLDVFEENSDDLSLLLQIFQLYFKSNNLAKAKEIIDKLMDLHSFEPEAQCAYIRLKVTTEKENAFPEIEKIYRELQKKYPEKPKIALEYALFERRKGISLGIAMLEKIITGACKFYPRAYSELATSYISNNELGKAKKIYQKGLSLFPADIALNSESLHLQLCIIKVQGNELNHALQYYKRFCRRFKHNKFMTNAMNEILYRANLEKYIPPKEAEEEIVCGFSKLSLNIPVLELLEKINSPKFKAYCIGGAPRYYYMLNELKVDFPLRLNDIDIFTNAPVSFLQKLFPEATQNIYNPNQLNFHYNGYPIDITSIDDIRIGSIFHYLKSQKGLNIDCLIIDKNKIIDPTKMAKKGLQERRIDLISDVSTTCRENPFLLFRILRLLPEYRCELAPRLLENNVLSKMASSLQYHIQPGRITSEIVKILTRGHGYESLNTMINHQVLAIINPTLSTYLQVYPSFNEWFFAQIAQTDNMVNAQLGLKPSKSYVTAIYLMPQVLEAFYLNQKEYLDDDLIDEVLFQTYGKRIERPQIRHHIYAFFSVLRYSFNHTPCDIPEFPAEQIALLPIDTEYNAPNINEEKHATSEMLIEAQNDAPTIQTQAQNIPIPTPPSLTDYLYSFLPSMPPIPNVWEMVNSARTYLTGYYPRPVSNQTTSCRQDQHPSQRKRKKKNNRYYR